MRYKGILPQRKPWVKFVFALLVGYMMYLEIRRGQWIYVPLGILVLLACFVEKEHLITAEGVDIAHTLFGFGMHNLWRWDEITTLHTDYKRARPNVMLHIGKDVVTRSFTMKHGDCQGALALAARQNPNIYIEDLSEEERDLRDQEILHRQEVLRAQKAAKKYKK